MDVDNQINNPRLTEAKHAALGLLKTAKITAFPVALNQLLPTVRQTFDITISGIPNAMFNGKGDAITQSRDSSIFILYNQDRPTVRKRFSVAHELGHLYLGHLHGNSSNDLNTKNFDELEANTFAAHLLMNPISLKKDIQSGCQSPELLAKKYEVSLEALWFQLNHTNLFKLL